MLQRLGIVNISFQSGVLVPSHGAQVWSQEAQLEPFALARVLVKL